MQIWGCYAVADHVGNRPFVGDVLLYERLVVPVPPPGEATAVADWEKAGWQPEKQAALLEVLGDVVVPVPWTSQRSEEWRQEWTPARAALDVDNAASIRRSWPGGVSPDAAMATRAVVSQSVAEKVFEDRDVRALSVYGDPVAFSREWRIERSLPFVHRTRRPLPQGYFEVARPDPAEPHRVAQLLVARLSVPEDSRRSDVELLKRALDLAGDPRMARWRADFHAWVDHVSHEGLRDETVVRELAGHVAAYNRTARLRLKKSVVRQTATVAASAGLAAIGGPAAGAGGKVPTARVATVLVDRIWTDAPVPGEEAAALLAEASKRLS